MKQASEIASRLRKLLITYDVRVAYAQGQVDLFDEQVKLYSVGDTKSERKKLAKARLYLTTWSTYLQNMMDKRSRLEDGIRSALRCYPPKMADIWVRRFIRGESNQMIADAVGENVRTISRVTERMTFELGDNFLLGPDEGGDRVGD